MSTIAENLNRVMDRVRNAARKAGREPGEVTLVCVTKTVGVKEIKEAVSGGARVFGENYVQEAAEKIKKIKDGSVRWHLIGHLQKNKVKHAVELFDVIHTVDSAGLADLINRRTKAPIDVLIQVNISGEETKRGVDPKEAPELARAISELSNLNLRGLMAIPPVTEDPEASRPYFITLRRLAERINRLRLPGVMMRDLSIGMSNDFDVAIEEGATMVRVGSAIFGEREKKPATPPAEKAEEAPAKKAPAPKKKATAAKKTAARKAPAKKEGAKKATAKKAAPKKKAAAKKTTTEKKAATKKKTATKKAAPKKSTAKKTTAKKAPAKKAAPGKTKKS